MAYVDYTFLSYVENEQGIFNTILRGHLDFSSDPWPSVSNSAKDLVKKMLRADPRERLSAVEVLSKFCYPGRLSSDHLLCRGLSDSNASNGFILKCALSFWCLSSLLFVFVHLIRVS